MAALTRSATDRLRSDFTGGLIWPGEEGYDAARAVWNGAIDRRPALIARAAGPGDVAAAVRFARERGLAASSASPRPDSRDGPTGSRTRLGRPYRSAGSTVNTPPCGGFTARKCF